MQCIGRTNLRSRCKNKCQFLFCKKHRFQPFIVIFTLATIFVTISTLYYIIWGEKTASQKDINQLSNQLSSINKRFEDFTLPDLNSNQKDPGFSTAITLKLISQLQYRRKYIFDIAQTENRNRVSLYLDPNNIMIFELIDNVGSIYNVKISKDFYEYAEFMILYCEYGINDEFSYFRILINGKYKEQNKFKFKIELPVNLQKAMTLSADIFGKNNIAMEIAEYMVFSGTLGKQSRDGLFSYLGKKYNIPISL